MAQKDVQQRVKLENHSIDVHTDNIETNDSPDNASKLPGFFKLAGDPELLDFTTQNSYLHETLMRKKSNVAATKIDIENMLKTPTVRPHKCPPRTNDHEIQIISGAYSKGKEVSCNEDAYFFTKRGFGVADGVSGWKDFGFSSQAFSNTLM